MTKPTASGEAIAVVGGGVAGLTAARGLARSGVAVAVFDKGRGVGGRTSTRRADGGRQFDHGAQYFTAASEEFRDEVRRWVEAGVAAEWTVSPAVLACDDAGPRREADAGEKTRYVGAPGMNAPAKRLANEAIAAGAAVSTGLRVASLEAIHGRWRLADDAGAPLGLFRCVLVTAPAPQAAALLAPSPVLADAAKAVRVTGCWSAMVSFDKRVEAGFDAAFVNGPPDATPFSWVSRDSAKPGRPADLGDAWVLHASPAWSEQRLDASRNEVLVELIAAFGRLVPAAVASPAFAAAHLWRFALPETPLADRCLADPGRGLYAAGDWCGGPRVEGAYLSGLAAADVLRAP